MTIEKLIYRLAEPHEREQLKTLGLEAYGQFAETLDSEGWQKLESALKDDEKLDELLRVSVSFVCCDGDRVVGRAHFVPSGNAWDVFPAEWSYIRMVGVLPSHQGQGIAKKLTRMCIDYAKQTEERTIALHTSEFMNAARHIYQSLGFQMLREIPPRFGKRYWLFAMEL